LDVLTLCVYSLVAELETFRQGLVSEVAVKENENKDILQKMKHVEQDLQVMTALLKHGDEAMEYHLVLILVWTFLHCSLFR
jgi:hypothetical protein